MKKLNRTSKIKCKIFSGFGSPPQAASFQNRGYGIAAAGGFVPAGGKATRRGCHFRFLFFDLWIKFGRVIEKV
ncbi:hypothetical protein AMJ49_05630 [Parcubacteria bacterium DG_74_2]|nr:MAG: hypothetical protein AMJ49_05630 [Parcubacteria bacterium DG_74_2]